MTKPVLTFLVVSFCAGPLLAQPPEMAWVELYNGTAGFYDAARAIAVDDSGYVCVTGNSQGAGTGQDYVTIRYYPDGDTVWARRHNGSSNVQDYGYAIAVDDSGCVYVTGGTWNSGSGEDWGTIKYYPSGDIAWVKTHNGPLNDWDEARAIAVDGDGNVCVAGYDRGSGSLTDFATIKYYPNGDTAWVRRYNGTGNSHDGVNDLTVDDAGNVYVTGSSVGSGTDYDFTTIKYSSHGVAAWVSRYDGPGNGNDHSHAIAVDGSGNVYVTGYIETSGGRLDYATIKYDPDGDTAWVRTYDGPESINDDDWSEDIAVDSSGNVYVTGMIDFYDKSAGGGLNGFGDYCTIKYYPNGDTAWVRAYDGPTDGDDGASALALDASGNVYVTGHSTGDGTERDYVTIRYDSDGEEAWVMRHDGPAGQYDDASDIAVDALGHVYVTGWVTVGGGYYDYGTIRYIQGPIREVEIRDWYFAPQVDTVQIGDNVRWTNYGPHAHTTTSDTKGSWNSGNLIPGDWFVYRFFTPGSYPYHCENNPFMTGTIVVATGSDVRDETGTRGRPSDFALSQNYPNPFNPTTRIEFTLAKSDLVSLEVYDLLGRKVRTLVSEYLSPGYKSVTWDGKNDEGGQVASGVYLYRMRAGELSQTKKMLLLK